MSQAPQGSMGRPGTEFARETGAEPVTEKAPEQSGKARALRLVLSTSYGDPVLERWRPGGTDLAIIGQGSQAYLSLPPRCIGVSYPKTAQQGSLQSLASVRMKGMVRETTRVAESATPARLTKGSSGDGWRRRT